MSVGRNLNDSTTSCLPNILSFLVWAHFFLHSSKMLQTVRIHWQCSHLGRGSFFKMYEWGTIQDNFILPTLSVRGLPISPEWLDKMKLVCNCIIPIILPSGKNMLVHFIFKIIIGYTNLGTRQFQSRLGSKDCLFITSNANMAGYPTKNYVFIGKL